MEKQRTCPALTADYRALVVNDVPLIDVRSPGEFTSGSIPGAANIPLLTDEERHQVGLTYRREGSETALRMARELVEAGKKDMLTGLWAAYFSRHPGAVVYCARGGMRSATAAAWTAQKIGTTVSRVKDGYKGFRTYLLSRLDPSTINSKPVLVGGRTGSGKTKLINGFANSIDLEAIANHRGSTFGRFTTPQPGQADFENRLAIAVIKHGHAGFSHLILEDEGRHVGKRFLPKELSEFFGSGQLIVLEAPFEERVENIYQEYVIASQEQYRAERPSEMTWAWFDEMNRNMDRIAKRLGAELLGQLKALLEAGCRHQEKNGDPLAHKHWIRMLLDHYYDPMYDYQLSKRDKQPVLAGKECAVTRYLRSLDP
jgi:tRNA 2-selenouridine synthase